MAAAARASHSRHLPLHVDGLAAEPTQGSASSSTPSSIDRRRRSSSSGGSSHRKRSNSSNQRVSYGSVDQTSELSMHSSSSHETVGEPALLVANKSTFLKRHLFALMGFLGFANVYAMRVNLSVAIVAMVNSTAIATNTSVTNISTTCPVPPDTPPSSISDGPFNWDESSQGVILGSFFWGYVLTQVPGGRLAELWGGKWLYGIGVLVTGIFTLLTPLAAKLNYYLFIAIRVLEGLGEGVTYPAMHAMLAKWSPPDERSKMSSRVYSGSQFGTVIALPVSGMLANQWGWESVFYVFGVLSLVWFGFWVYLVYDTPDKHPTISREEKEHIINSLGHSSTSNPPVPFKHILTSVSVWALVFTHMAQNWGFYTLLTELPTYMKNILHFDIKANAFISALPYLIMWLVALFSSIVADYILGNNFMDRCTTRKLFNSLAFCLPAVFLVLAAFSGCNTSWTVAFLALAGGLNGMHYSGFMSVHIDMSPNFAGTLLGITNAFANTMGFLAPIITGQIINQHQDLAHWESIFLIAAGVYGVGTLIFIFLGSAQEQHWNRLHESSTQQETTVFSTDGDDGDHEENQALLQQHDQSD